MTAKGKTYLEIARKRALEKKTHVSFPQLKYPSLRDEGFKDGVQWLAGKAMYDGAEGLWRVHNGIYDLTDFVKRHPGGADWLQLTKGTDVTEAFESHHLNPAVEKVLHTFFVREAKTPRNSPFTYENNGFFRTLKRAVAEEVKKLPKTVTIYSKMITDVLFIALLLSAALTCWFKNHWLVMSSYIATSVIFGWMTIAAHNFVHQKDSWRMYLFNFSMVSYRDLRISHALSHHLYTNTLMDLEISGSEPLLFFTPIRNRPIYSKFQVFVEVLLFHLAFIMSFVKRCISYFVRKDFYTEHFGWHHFIGLALPVWMMFASGCTAYEALTMWLWLVCSGSFCAMCIGFNVGHHHPLSFKDGDQLRQETRDWGIHQLDTCMDSLNINGNIFRVLTFFGDHVLHHLFPSLDHGYLDYLHPVLLKHCEQFKVDYRQRSSLDLIHGQIMTLLETKPKILGVDT